MTQPKQFAQQGFPTGILHITYEQHKETHPRTATPNFISHTEYIKSNGKISTHTHGTKAQLKKQFCLTYFFFFQNVSIPRADHSGATPLTSTACKWWWGNFHECWIWSWKEQDSWSSGACRDWAQGPLLGRGDAAASLTTPVCMCSEKKMWGWGNAETTDANSSTGTACVSRTLIKIDETINTGSTGVLSDR